MAIKKNYVVCKNNVLNEIRANCMTLQELRIFSIYLSKINPSDINTRLVRFSLDDFARIMELRNLRANYISNVIDDLLCKIVKVPTADGGFEPLLFYKANHL